MTEEHDIAHPETNPFRSLDAQIDALAMMSAAKILLEKGDLKGAANELRDAAQWLASTSRTAA